MVICPRLLPSPARWRSIWSNLSATAPSALPCAAWLACTDLTPFFTAAMVSAILLQHKHGHRPRLAHAHRSQAQAGTAQQPIADDMCSSSVLSQTARPWVECSNAAKAPHSSVLSRAVCLSSIALQRRHGPEPWVALQGDTGQAHFPDCT